MPATLSFADESLADRLLIARRGTAYFAQRLADLGDDELAGPSLLSDWSRMHLIAHVGYNAVALCRLLDWAATGMETPMYESTQQRAAEIAEGATLNPAALRNLFTHTVARLDEKWRHLPEAAWDAAVRTAQGRTVPAAETVWMRTREVWIHTVDLDNDGRFGDFPPVVLDSLLHDVVGMWRRKGVGADLLLVVDGHELAVDESATPTRRVSGSLPAVVRWVTGRGAVGLTGDLESGPPPWL